MSEFSEQILIAIVRILKFSAGVFDAILKKERKE